LLALFKVDRAENPASLVANSRRHDFRQIVLLWHIKKALTNPIQHKEGIN
jgi:hypothetical protein